MRKVIIVLALLSLLIITGCGIFEGFEVCGTNYNLYNLDGELIDVCSRSSCAYRNCIYSNCVKYDRMEGDNLLVKEVEDCS